MGLRRLIAAAVVALCVPGSPAGAHPDHNADARRCDSWSRAGHTTRPGDSHDHAASSDIVLNDPMKTVVHAHSGHYVIRNDAMYLEIVGGQAYRGPDPNGKVFPGQGGYVQGEVDPVAGGPDADFHAAAFSPDVDHPPAPGDAAGWAEAAYGRGCVNGAGNHAEQQTRQP